MAQTKTFTLFTFTLIFSMIDDCGHVSGVQIVRR